MPAAIMAPGAAEVGSYLGAYSASELFAAEVPRGRERDAHAPVRTTDALPRRSGAPFGGYGVMYSGR